jgi:peptide/nickel transport system permease protein
MALMGGLLCATLARFAPGFGIDERSLDARFSAETLESIARDHDWERNPLRFYFLFLSKLIRGDAGHSAVFNQGVGALIRERAPVTLMSVAEGLIAGWVTALALASVAAPLGRRAVRLATMGFNGALLSVPSAVLATLCVLFRLPPGVAIAGVILPRVYPHIYEQLRGALAAADVLMARASGLSPLRVAIFYVAPATAPALIALAGVSTTLAFGASIPIEALSDSPGLGQMAWRAALGRDLPVLVSVTMLLTTVAVASNTAADLILLRLRHAA